MNYISESLRWLVEERADYQCEYCQLLADVSFYPHEVDHVIALKHRGQTLSEKLAYPALFMMILGNLQKACHEVNLAICLKNSLFFEVSLTSRFQQLVNNPG